MLTTVWEGCFTFLRCLGRRTSGREKFWHMVSGTSCYGLSLTVLVSGGLMAYPQGCRQCNISCTRLPGPCASEGWVTGAVAT